ncbi:DUF6968 family protein [Nocardia sp. Marseille-Q1738]
MQDDELGEPIATRELCCDGSPVVVTFGKPVQEKDGWSCGFRIEGIGRKPVTRRSRGVDSVHALLLAMSAARRILAHRKELYTYRGSADLGFPSVV